MGDSAIGQVRKDQQKKEYPFMRNLILLIFIMLTSGCSYLLCSNGLGCEAYYKEELDKWEVERWNKWLGKTKDDRIREIGPPDKCSHLSSDEEACEWRQSGVRGGGSYNAHTGYGSSSISSWEHRILFVYDREHIAQQWRYSGTYGNRASKPNHKQIDITNLGPAYKQASSGFDAYQRKDYLTALKEWKPLAEEGNPVAQMGLGSLYHQGNGVEKDINEAMKWYHLAANQGNSVAQYLLGVIYHKAIDIPQDNHKAAHWLGLAAEQGEVEAQYLLGKIYREHNDYKKAIPLLRLAAEQGHAAAQTKIGVMYFTGKELPRDYQEAGRWLRMAADQGDALGQLSCGILLKELGEPKDYAAAYMWLTLAEAKGMKKAAEEREKLAEKMTSEQIAEAQLLMRQWKPNKGTNKELSTSD